MFEISCIDHIVLRTTKIEKMIDFYCNILNCTIERVQDQIGLTQLRAGDCIIDLLKVDNEVHQAHRNLGHFCLRINPFDGSSLQDYFKSKGIESLRYGQRYSAIGYTFSLYLLDPEDNEVELTG